MLVNVYIYWYKYIYVVFFPFSCLILASGNLKFKNSRRMPGEALSLSLSPRLEILAKIIFCSIDFFMALYNSATQL